VSDSSESENSFDYSKRDTNTLKQYITTGLIAARNLTLNMIDVDRKQYGEIEHLVRDELKKGNVFFRKNNIIDPKKVLKEAKAYGTVESLVNDEEIRELV